VDKPQLRSEGQKLVELLVVVELMTGQSFRRRFHCARLLACAVISVGITGCATQETKSSTSVPPVQTIGPVTDTKDLLLPLDYYMFSLKDYRLLSEAHGILLRRCMQRFGITYQIPSPTEGGIQTRNERRYGITDTAEARRYGYRLPGATDYPAPSSAQDRDPKVIAVLTGEGGTSVNGQPVPADGCVGESQRFLGENLPGAAADIAQPMAMKSWNQSAADHRVQVVFASWSACMKKAGFNYQTPLEPSRDRDLRRQVSAAQIRTAVADTLCKKEHNVIGTWAAVEAAYQEVMIRENKSALDLLRRASMMQLQAAHSVVSKR
jgi:hypothetical protein